MKANEHEYKIMGLAPYANPKQKNVKKLYQLLSSLHTLDKLKITARIDERHFQYFLENNVKRYRFDLLAYTLQKVIEEKLCKWVKNAVKYTDIKTVCCAGGIFMNVKANKKIAELDCVDTLLVMPSSSDESTAIGASYLGYIKYCKKNALSIHIEPLKHLYLGNKFSNKYNINKYIKNNNLEEKYNVKYYKDPEKETARLLAKGKIIARFAGKMEFGQRALGNRSILADPSDCAVIRKLNNQIKSRDFWMPFTASILYEDKEKYIVNPKNLEAFYMILGFDTKPETRSEIMAAIHPYDYTIRPQIVTERMNKKYYALIKEFKKLTGIGAVLNTSFNIHGEPIVCSIDNAFRTFENSGLEYLQMENYLFQKVR